jgi:hypothetical protein
MPFDQPLIWATISGDPATGQTLATTLRRLSTTLGAPPRTNLSDTTPLDLGFTLAGLAGDALLRQRVSDAPLDGCTQAGGIAPSRQDLEMGAGYAGAGQGLPGRQTPIGR